MSQGGVLGWGSRGSHEIIDVWIFPSAVFQCSQYAWIIPYISVSQGLPTGLTESFNPGSDLAECPSIMWVYGTFPLLKVAMPRDCCGAGVLPKNQDARMWRLSAGGGGRKYLAAFWGVFAQEMREKTQYRICGQSFALKWWKDKGR